MDHLTPAQWIQLRERLASAPEAVRSRCERSMLEGVFGLCAICGEDLDVGSLLERPEMATCPSCVAQRRDERALRRFGVCGVKGG